MCAVAGPAVTENEMIRLSEQTHSPKRARSERAGRRWGGAIIETAFALPVLIAVAMGSIEFGYFFYTKHCVQSAARDGVRSGIVAGGTNSNVTTAVQNSMTAAGLQNSGYTVTIRHASTNANLTLGSTSAGTPVRVTVSCTWGAVGVSPLGVIPSNKPVSGATVMYKE
jgi:Flp pilus assembly protein TadG